MNRAIQRVTNAVSYLQKHGISGFMRELMYRASTTFYERYFGVDTRGYINPEDLGFPNAEFHAYSAVGYNELFKMLERIPVRKSESAFLDYGSGKGRAVVVAASYPFKRVIGIELSLSLLEAAKDNARKMRHKRAESIDLYQADATQFVVPEDVNIIYFFNPFKGQVLQDVVNNIHDSYKNHPREIYILFFNNAFFEKITADQNWIRRIYQTSFYPVHSCGLYVTK